MDEHRRTVMLSNSTSGTSVPSIESDLYVKQLQQQLQIIRSENEDFAENTLKLQNRIHQLEEDRLVVSSTLNKENSELQSLVARLQSQLERGEASRQSLEYDLALVKKKLNDVTRSTTHKEVTLAKQTLQLSDEKSSLELKLGETENELVVARQLTADNEKRIALLEDERKQSESDRMAAEAILRAESEKLSSQLHNVQCENEQLKLSIDDSKKHAMAQESHLQQLANDVRASAEREQRLRSDMDGLAQRARSLEECVEAERAAHLESKFNSEIIQLKHEEFQNQLANEKDSCEKLKLANEENVARLTELEKQLEFERHQTKNANAKLDKTMQAYADVRKQLDEELSVKNHVIKETSSKLEEHQDELIKVKDELNKSKKKLLYLEENHNADIREIELLLESFCNDEEAGLKSRGDGKLVGDHSKFVLELLRKNLFGYQKRISELQIQIEDHKSTKKQLLKDCENFRDVALSREKSMHTTQQALSQCKDELESIQKCQVEYVQEANKAGRDLEEVTSELQHQRDRCQELEEGANAIKERHNNEVEAHIAFLRELHHVVCSVTGEKNTLSRFGWSDISVTIRESVDVLINNLQRGKDKITQLESSAQEMQQSINELQRAHAASVDRLADRCRERDEEGARQRKQLEQHYEALLAEMNARTRKTQTLCDEAWERIHSKEGLHDGLQAECAQLRGENSNLQQEKKALASACAILFGALYPIFRARDELAQQRSLLARINSEVEVSKRKMRSLVSTLNDELSKPGKRSTQMLPKSFRFIHPLIRFRVAALCVLACNRLQMITQHSNVIMFDCDESTISCRRVLIFAGKKESNSSEREFKDKLPVKSRSDAAVDWLSDSHVVHGVRDATCGLVEAVEKNAGDKSVLLTHQRSVCGKRFQSLEFANAFLAEHLASFELESNLRLRKQDLKSVIKYQTAVVFQTRAQRNISIGYMSRAVVKTAKTAFLNLIECTHDKFPGFTTRVSRRDHTSLCRLLSRGLDKLLHTSSLQQVAALFSVEHSFSALQQHLIDFTERLHAAEVEKRDLRHNESALKSEVEQLRSLKSRYDEYSKEMKTLKEKEKSLVSRGRFEGVCSELNSALDREKKAQKLLREQNAKLQDLSGKYEEHCNSEAEKEVTLSQAITSLTEVKMDLKRCAQNKNQLERQVGKLTTEKDKLQKLVQDAKSALKRAAGEKTSIANYFAVVENALNSNSNEEAAEKLRLQSEEVVENNGSGMKAAKRAVDSFMRAQSSAIARINNLESQIASYRTHISSLKRELHNACHRESEHTGDVELYDVPTKDPSRLPGDSTRVPANYYSSPLGDGSEFKPLQGELIEEPSFNKTNTSRNGFQYPGAKPSSTGDFNPSAKPL